eukprot:Rhum_TRINITY_DN8323_c0_g1::Rhum_TRINITY_DN8323_c0_g1_i1::g.27306::m.27306
MLERATPAADRPSLRSCMKDAGPQSTVCLSRKSGTSCWMCGRLIRSDRCGGSHPVVIPAMLVRNRWTLKVPPVAKPAACRSEKKSINAKPSGSRSEYSSTTLASASRSSAGKVVFSPTASTSSPKAHVRMCESSARGSVTPAPPARNKNFFWGAPVPPPGPPRASFAHVTWPCTGPAPATKGARRSALYSSEPREPSGAPTSRPTMPHSGVLARPPFRRFTVKHSMRGSSPRSSCRSVYFLKKRSLDAPTSGFITIATCCPGDIAGSGALPSHRTRRDTNRPSSLSRTAPRTVSFAFSVAPAPVPPRRGLRMAVLPLALWGGADCGPALLRTWMTAAGPVPSFAGPSGSLTCTHPICLPRRAWRCSPMKYRYCSF